MISRRNWLMRCGIAGLVLYLFTHISIRNGAAEFISELQQSGRSLAALDSSSIAEVPQSEKSIAKDTSKIYELSKTSAKIDQPSKDKPKQVPVVRPAVDNAPITEKSTTDEPASDVKILGNIMRITPKTEPPIRETTVEKDSRLPVTSNLSMEEEMALQSTTPRPIGQRLKELLKCNNRPMISRTQQRGDYWVLSNYVRAETTHQCHESITYTTHADYTFMDNLVPLVERWLGPVSIAMHAPGTDFTPTLNTIKYLRDCTSPLIKKYVTFHVFFSTRHVPLLVPRRERVLQEPYNCSVPIPYQKVNVSQMYKSQKKLLYPVNVGRNVARENAQTHFILPSDIELYPSLNLIPQFLEMIAENKGPLLRKNPRVFVLSIFEVAASHPVPDNKTKLKELLANGTAIEFHKKVCHTCHRVPKSKEWQLANVTEGLHIFHVGKRMGQFVHWEPIFIGTHSDPLYDERLSWEGKSDKMPQGYVLCVLDYDFQILDNAFVCHKPGIKTYKKDTKREVLAGKTNQLIRKKIYPEMKVLYGIRKGCAV